MSQHSQITYNSNSRISASPRRVLQGTERIRLAEDIANKAELGQPGQSSLGIPTTGNRSQFSLSQIPRTASSGQIQNVAISNNISAGSQGSHTVGDEQAPAIDRVVQPYAEPEQSLQAVRRTQSEIIEPGDYDQTRRHTLVIPVSAASDGRERSGTVFSAGSRPSHPGGEVSQSQALAHEVLQEAKTDAMHRQNQEAKHKRSKILNASKSWRNWFMKAPDNVD